MKREESELIGTIIFTIVLIIQVALSTYFGWMYKKTETLRAGWEEIAKDWEASAVLYKQKYEECRERQGMEGVREETGREIRGEESSGYRSATWGCAGYIPSASLN